MTTETAPIAGPMKVVGRAKPKAEARGIVTGGVKYVADLSYPGMLHCKALLSPYAACKIVSIDTTRARSLPGVVDVITHAEVPHNRHGYVVADQPVLAEGEVRYLGEPIAVVAAIDEMTAANAVKLIDVTYEPYDPIVDPEAALAPGARLIHEDGNINRIAPHQVLVHQNMEDLREEAGLEVILKSEEAAGDGTRVIRMGDVETAFAEADFIVESTYETQIREHTPMETHASLAYVDPSGTVVVHTCSQAPHLHQLAVAEILQLPLHRVQLAGGYVGGGFGAKNDVSVDHLTALLALRTKRPVRWLWTREEEALISTVDQAYTIHIRSAVKEDGTITGREVRALMDSGAYHVFAQAGILKFGAMAKGPYRILNYDFEGVAAYTNKPPAGAMRGFNVADAHFAFECHTDEIAERLGMDPLELRMKNITLAGDPSGTHAILSEATVRECILAAADASGWKSPERGDAVYRAPELAPPSAPWKRRGQGIVGGWQGGGEVGGGDPTHAEIEITGEGAALLRVGATEIGAGQATSLTMIAAEALGLELEAITTVFGNTATTPFDFGTFGNRTTYALGDAVIKAAQAVFEDAVTVAAAEWQVDASEVACDSSGVYLIANPEQRLSLADLAAAALWTRGRALNGRGSHLGTPCTPDAETGGGALFDHYVFAACYAEVEVDLQTGEVEVTRLVAVNDVGRAINPLFVEGQMEGGTSFGVGNALLEEIYPRYPEIWPAARGIHEYKVPTVMDMPREHTSVILEIPTAHGPFGARSLGEATVHTQTPAILNAIADATGIRLHRIPATPQRVLSAILADGRYSEVDVMEEV